MKSYAGENLYLCALCNQELINRNYPQRQNKGHAMDNPYLCSLFQGIHLQQPIKETYVNMNNGKFIVTVLFNILEQLKEIFRFGNVIDRQKNIKVCIQKLFAAG